MTPELHRPAASHTVRTRRFLDAFSAANHDRRLERRGRLIVHFFDSDFLGRLIFGYQDAINQELIRETQERRPDSNAWQRLLMGALLSQRIGAPPNMRALLPHLFEVRRSVEGPRSHGPRFSPQQTIADLGIAQSLEGLRRTLEAKAGPEELFARFIGEGPEIFYGTELLSGAWQARLGRVLALGIGEPGPYEEAPEVVDTDAFEVLARHVAHTADGQGSVGVNGVRDAMALATLAAAVEDADDRPLARFYTETPRIHRAWRDSAEMRELLSYGSGPATRPDAEYAEEGVLRTVEYYVIRALIPELGYATEADDEQSDLFKIAGGLTETTKALERSGVSESQLSDVRVGDQSLAEIMEAASDLSLFGTAWRSLMENVPPGLPGELARQLEEVIEGKRERTDDLQQQFSRHVRTLSDRTREVGEFTDIYARVREILMRWKGALKPRLGTSYCAHVGLTRWGLVPSEADEQALGRLIELYAEWREEIGETEALSTSRTGFVIEIAQRLVDMGTAPLRGPDELTQCIAVLGLLWLVKDHASTIEYSGRFLRGIELALRGGTGELSAETLQDKRWNAYGAVAEGLRSAAELEVAVAALSGAPDKEETDRLIARARELVDRLERSKPMRHAGPEVKAIAQGYVLFSAWRVFNPTLMADDWTNDVKPKQQKLVRDSLEIASAALEAGGPDSPSVPLLLNHCVYVASNAKLIDDRVDGWAVKLMLHRLSPQQSLSYRVDDTLAYYYYARAAMTLAEDSERRESAIGDLREARRWLEEVPEEVKDQEVVAHRGLLRNLERKLGL